MKNLVMTQAQVDAHNLRVRGARKVTLMPTQRPAKYNPKKWDYEGKLANQLIALGITEFEREYPWLPKRKYKADIVFVNHRLLVEVDGAAHRIKGRFMSDIIKSQDAVLNGWRLLRVSTAQVRSGMAAEIVKRALEAR